MAGTPKDGRRDELPPLGDLEVQVLEHVWTSGSTTAKVAYGQLGTARGISLNTVQSTLERLYRKGLLERVKSGHAYHYSAAVAREQLIADLINGVLGRFESDAYASAAAIMDAVDRLDNDTVSLLEAEIRRRRQSGDPS